MKVTALAGGVGGSKLLVGLQRACEDLTVVVNTADDEEIYGVHVSPDIDIVTYWLAGIADFERGWGLKDDTFTVTEALGSLGVDNWFNLGDRDFATCLVRTKRLAEGATLSDVTDETRLSLGVPTRIIPMSDDPVRTRFTTDTGDTLDFQEYFVRERQQPAIRDVRYAGIADAKPAPGVLEAIRSSDRVVICPSNPVVSIGPILSLSEVRETLAEHPKVIAVSPIIAGAPVKGPADKLMAAQGHEVSARGVASLYSDFVDVFVVDERDAQLAAEIEEAGTTVLITDTLMVDHEASERLARALL